MFFRYSWATEWQQRLVQLFETPWTSADQDSLSFIHCPPEFAQVYVYEVGDDRLQTLLTFSGTGPGTSVYSHCALEDDKWRHCILKWLIIRNLYIFLTVYRGYPRKIDTWKEFYYWIGSLDYGGADFYSLQCGRPRKQAV